MNVIMIHYVNFFNIIGATEPNYVARHLSTKGDLSVVVPSKKGPNTFRSDIKANIHQIPLVSLKLRWITVLFNTALLPYLMWLQITKKFDIVFTYHRVLLAPWILKRLFRVKWVCDVRVPPIAQDQEFSATCGEQGTSRSLFYRLLDCLNRWFLPRADLVITLSDGIKEELVAKYRVLPENIHILPLGVDLERFSVLSGAKVLRQESGRLTLIYVGSVNSFRGIETLIEAVAALQKDISNVKLVVVGGGQDEHIVALKELATKLGVDANIEWTGIIPHTAVIEKLAEADFALSPLPDLYSYRVSSPAKVVEYLASGKVVIATDLPCHRTVIKNGWNGFLYPPGDTSIMVGIIKRLLGNDKVRAEICVNARKSAKAFDWKNMLERLEDRLGQL